MDTNSIWRPAGIPERLRHDSSATTCGSRVVRSLSSSDAFRALIENAKALSYELAGADPPPAELAEADLAGLLGAVVRLYVQLARDPYDARRLAAMNITPTDACTVA